MIAKKILAGRFISIEFPFEVPQYLFEDFIYQAPYLYARSPSVNSVRRNTSAC